MKAIAAAFASRGRRFTEAEAADSAVAQGVNR
jgi:hypothetical protein